MLMIVFGAGASYDSVPALPPESFPNLDDRPPLASQLFELRAHFVEALTRFPRCRPIVPYLQGRRDGVAVEKILQELHAEAGEYPERYNQLAAIRYYLQLMLWQCENRWAKRSLGVTNQGTLLDQVRQWSGHESVLLVTFNYDRLLEEALSAVGQPPIKQMSDYIAPGKFRLIKLHGSVNWARELQNRPSFKTLDGWHVANHLIDVAVGLKPTSRFHIMKQLPNEVLQTSFIVGMSEYIPLFPAIALPVQEKLDFECPETHVEALRALIPKVDRILCIGWRGAELTFLQLLAEHLSGPVRALIVNGSDRNCGETVDRLRNAGVTGEFTAAQAGFTQLVLGKEAVPLFRS